MVIVMNAHVPQRLAVGSADVGGHSSVQAASAATGGGDGRFDIGMHEAATEDALALTHPGDDSRQLAIAHRRAQPRYRRLGLIPMRRRSQPGRRRMALAFGIERRRAKLFLVHGASISPPRRDRKGLYRCTRIHYPRGWTADYRGSTTAPWRNAAPALHHVTWTVPLLPGLEMLIPPPHAHMVMQPLCSAG